MTDTESSGAATAASTLEAKTGQVSESPDQGSLPILSEFERALASYAPVTRIEPSNKLIGIIVRENSDGFFVDVRAKEEVFLPLLWALSEDGVGDEVETLVVHAATEVKPAQVTRLHTAAGSHEAVLDKLIEKGGRAVGFRVSIGKIRAFLPISELATFWPSNRSASDLVGNRLPVKFLAVEVQRGPDPVVSNKAAVKDAREEALSRIKPGDVYSATVTAIPKINTGVAVTVHVPGPQVETSSALPGFIRRSEVVEHGNRPCCEVLSLGQTIEVAVTAVEEDTGKLYLAYRSLIAKRFIDEAKIDDVVDAIVVANVEFGTFVRLGTCVRALLHHRYTRKIRGKTEVFEPGQKIRVKIVELSSDKGRIGVSTRGIVAQQNDRAGEQTAAA